MTGSNHLVTVEAEAGRRRNSCLLTALVMVELEKHAGIQGPCHRSQGYQLAVCGRQSLRPRINPNLAQTSAIISYSSAKMLWGTLNLNAKFISMNSP